MTDRLISYLAKLAASTVRAKILLSPSVAAAGFDEQKQGETQTVRASGPILFTDCDNSMNGQGSPAVFSVSALWQTHSRKKLL
jgi:hypothetical protein